MKQSPGLDEDRQERINILLEELRHNVDDLMALAKEAVDSANLPKRRTRAALDKLLKKK